MNIYKNINICGNIKNIVIDFILGYNINNERNEFYAVMEVFHEYTVTTKGGLHYK